MRADNTEHLIAAAKRRSASSVERVRDTLRDLHRSGKPVTVAGVARQANVSRTFLHSQPEFLEAIRSLRTQNDGLHPIPARERASEKSLLTRIEGLTTANKKLRDDNTKLRKRLELALGDLRELQQRLPSDSPTR
jgi:hypothetical protein